MFHTLPDVVGTGVAVQLATTGIPARAIQVNVISGGSGTDARIGDSHVTSSRGLPIYAQGGQMLPPIPDMPGPNYTLASVYVWVGVGDVIAAAYWD